MYLKLKMMSDYAPLYILSLDAIETTSNWKKSFYDAHKHTCTVAPGNNIPRPEPQLRLQQSAPQFNL